MDEIRDCYIYCLPLPGNVKEMVTPCADGCYTIYVEDSLYIEQRQKEVAHALAHIYRDDFEKEDVQEIECGARES